MPANPFDQFDAPTQGGNPFDQFDAAPIAQRAAVDDNNDGMQDFPDMPGQGRPASPEPSPFRGVRDYFSRVNEAANRAAAAKGPSILGVDAGTLEAAASLFSGGVLAPLMGTVEGIDDAMAGREPDPDASFARYTYQPRTESGKAQLGLIGEVARPVTESGLDQAVAPLFAGESQAVRVPTNAARRPGAGPVLRGAGGEMVEARAPAQAIPRSAAAGREASVAGVAKEAPTLEELSSLADQAYKRADEAGIVVKESSLKGLKARIVTAAKKEGIDADLHPDSSAVLKKIIKSNGDLTLSELETLRKVSSDAKGSLKPADRRIASQITEQLDDYIDNLSDADVIAGDATKAKALKEARSLYSRKKKAEEINQLIKSAEDSAANFSGSGLENALRTEFRKLAKNEKRMRRFTAEEQAAIRKVARGGPAENALRFIGKFAPTGVVSAALGGSLGTLVAGPLGGALPLAGLAGRAGATRMTMRNARAAEELMRRGRGLEPARNKLAEPINE